VPGQSHSLRLERLRRQEKLQTQIASERSLNATDVASRHCEQYIWRADLDTELSAGRHLGDLAANVSCGVDLATELEARFPMSDPSLMTNHQTGQSAIWAGLDEC
jgi:hypothetical protein